MPGVWFEDLVGFAETSGDEVRAGLRVDGDRMTSLVNGRQMGCGVLETPSLAELRARCGSDGAVGPSSLRVIVGDAGALHRDPANAGATFQAASQFNLLEMVSPHVTPDAGVSGYENDHTQGPACAVACGAGTIYRNYFVEIDGQLGQTADRQLDCLADLGRHLFGPEPAPWSMRNGYALFDRAALDAVNGRLGSLGPDDLDTVRSHLRVGVHRDVEVTSVPSGHAVTQVYCSALPVAYNREPVDLFEPLARVVLEAAYEATLHAASLTAASTGNRTVFLTMVGGGVFGNDESWIVDAIERGFRATADAGLDVAVVSYRPPSAAVADLGRRLA